MIQDIAPRHLDNQYRNITPDAKDTIFFFEGNTVLASQNGDSITYPEYGDFIEKLKKHQEQMLMRHMILYIYSA